MSISKSTFGSRLRSERVSLNKNQHEFGVIGGVSGKSQGYYERDERRPDSDYLARISSHVDVAYLLTGTKADSYAYNSCVSEPSAEYVNNKPDSKSFNAKLALKSAELLEVYSNQYVIDETNRLGIYQMLYMALCLKEYNGQDTDIESMLSIMSRKK